MTITIRTATPADLDILLGFEQGVIAAERPSDPTLAPDPIRYYDIPQLIAAPHIELCVAERDGAVVGSGYARIQPAEPYLAHREFAYLGFIYVRPDARGLGISAQIIATLARWARGRGVNEVRLEVYATNAAALRAYAKAGLVSHMITMRLASGPT